MKSLYTISISITLIMFGASKAEANNSVPPIKTQPPAEISIKYKHGDCSWIAPVAIEAGWEAKQIPRLVQIIQRESGCCPNRIGGDVVDTNCNVIGVSEWTHRSDSGLLQINGVHWKPDHAQYAGLICKQMKICTQKPLLDAETNLRAGRLIFEVAGWKPWATN